MVASDSIAMAVPYRASRRNSIRMWRDHFGFFTFLVLLLIAPKMPLDYEGLPGDSGLSLGFVGLIIWAILSPGYLTRFTRLRAPVVVMLVGFGAYVWAVSLLTAEPIPLGYASQYLFYILLSSLLLVGYFNRAIRFNQVDRALAIFLAVGLVFAIGLIISFWTGPFYSHQARDAVQAYGGLKLTRAIGFGGSVNLAASSMVVFAAFALFGPMRNWLHLRFLMTSTIFAALMLTSSRGAVFAVFAAILLLIPLRLLNLSASTRGTNPLIATTAMVLVIGGSVLVATTFVPSIAKSPLVAPTVSRFSLGEGSGVIYDAAARGRIWERGIDNWTNSGFIRGFIGDGFHGARRSTTFAWVTPHNTYIAMLGDFGFFGLLLFSLPLLGLVAALALRIINVKRATFESFAFVSLVALLINGMDGIIFYSPIIMSLTLVVVVLASTTFWKTAKAQ